jgi:uncharacterized membrane protein YfcA
MGEIIGIFLIGLFAGFFDSLIGAGGLISIPALVFLGFPPQVAIATDRLGTLGQSVAAFWKFWKAKKIVWKYVVGLSVISFLGSVIGANLLLHTDTAILEKAVGALIVILLPFIFFKQGAKSGNQNVLQNKAVFGFILFFLIMILGGFLGQGTGPLIFYTLTYFLGLTMIEVLATTVIPWLILSLSSLIIFINSGVIDYRAGIILIVGMAIGGYLGAHFAIKKGNVWVKRIFAVFVLVSAIKLLFF